jgi:DNA-binding transcriptional MerR regulator
MNQQIPIQDIAAQFNLTSRTLRYWEQKGLYKSSRDSQSNWRVYGNEAIERIRLVVLLRELDIPIKNIKKIIETGETCTVANVFEMQLHKLGSESHEIMKKVDLLNKCLNAVNSLDNGGSEHNFIEKVEKTLSLQMSSKQNLKCEWEEIVMSNNPILSGALRIISLPAMRVAVCNVISESPEDEALGNVLKWAGEENLMGTARIFGFNTTPYSPESAEYGWAACITIPEQVKIPEYLEEKRLPGGLYASFNSTNEVYDSWQTLMRLLKECEEYEVDKNRPCLEEHILSGELKEQGNDFYLTLLEPVRKLAL